MVKWRYWEESETCDCSENKTYDNLLRCGFTPLGFVEDNLATANKKTRLNHYTIMYA